MAQQRMEDWEVDLVRATQNRQSARTGCPLRMPNGYRAAYELTGVDGRYEGGQKVFPGFEVLVTLDPETTWGSTPASPPSDYTISSFRSVPSFRIGESSFGYGFVYRVSNGNDSGGNDEHLFIKYRRNSETAWQERQLDWYIPSTATKWDVVVWGQLVYVFVEGRSPILFYVTEDTPSTFVEVQVGGQNASTSGTTTGPGIKPPLLKPDHSLVEDFGKFDNPDDTYPSGDERQDATGHAQIVITATTPAAQTGYGGTLLMFDDGTNNPSVGSYDGPQANDDVVLLEPGDYVLAFQFSDSRTGRKSQLSDCVEVAAADFPSSGSAAGYVALEVVYDTTVWDTLRVYRSVAGEEGGGTYGSAYKHLDNVIDLSDYEVYDQTDMDANTKRAVYYYEATDKVLATQATWLDSDVYDTEMPKAGSAIRYNTTLVCSSISGSTVDSDDVDALGEVRFSSVVDSSLELFPPSNRFVPNLITDEVVIFEQINDILIGWTRNRVKFFRKDGVVILAPRDLHTGYGIVSPRASAVVGGRAYYIGRQGIRVIDSGAALDASNIADHTISEEWRGQLSNISVAYDSLLEALFFLNPDTEEAIVFWFSKTKTTHLVDMLFEGVEKGSFPEDPSDTTTELVERAMFLHSYGEGSTGRYEIMAVDANKAAGGKRNMLPVTGDSVLTVLTIAAISGDDVSVQFTGSPTLSNDMVGKKVYIIKGGTTTHTCVGEAGTITEVVSSDTLKINSSSAHFASLAQGDKLGVSPVVFRWVGSPLPNFDGRRLEVPDKGMHERQVNDIRPVWSGVGGNADGTMWATYRGLVYERDDTLPAAYNVPRDQNMTQKQGVEDGVATYAASPRAIDESAATALGVTGGRGYRGTSLAPGVEVVCPDLDFVLVGCRISGMIDTDDSPKRARSD